MNALMALRAAFGDWLRRIGWGFVITDDEATELGFLPHEVARARLYLEAVNRPDLLPVAMDAARLYNESLDYGVELVAGMASGRTRDIRRSGYDSLRSLRENATGQAKASAQTFHGQSLIREARRERAAAIERLPR